MMTDLSLQLVWQLPAALLSGLLLNLTPCVMPAIPVKIRTILRYAGAEPRHRLLAAFAFVGGTLTLLLPLGGVTALLHWNWGTLFQTPAVESVLVLVLLGFAVMTWFDIPLPVPSLAPHTEGHRYVEAFVSGLLSAILAAPCAGPFLGGVLVFAVTQPVSVILLIFVLIGVGLSLPYIVLLLRPDWLRRLPAPGHWLVAVRQVLAWVLVAAAIFFSASLVPAQVYRAFWWLWLAMIFLWCLYLLRQPRWADRILASLSLVAALVVTLVIAGPFGKGSGGVKWVSYSSEVLQRAEAAHQPRLLEFTADWCINCKVLEETVYSSPAVARALSRAGVVPVQVDMTRSNPAGEALLARYGGHALPYAVVVAPDNRVQAQFSGLFDASELIAVIDHTHSTVSGNQRSPAGPAQSSDKVRTHVVWENQDDRKLSIRLEIAQGWHVNANPASLAFLIPTQVGVSVNGRSLAYTANYPKGQDSGIRLDGKIILVYDNGTLIKLRPNPEALPVLRKSEEITITTQIQACNNAGICLAPSALRDQLVLPLQ